MGIDISEITDLIDRGNPIPSIQQLDHSQLEIYIRHRLAEKKPFVPPLRAGLKGGKENPRDFIDVVLIYYEKTENKEYQKITSTLASILKSFDPERTYSSDDDKDGEMKLLSHTLYLCSTHKVDKAKETIWNLQKSGAYEGERSIVGPVRVLITEAAGCFEGGYNTVDYWKEYFRGNPNKEDRFTAFANLYMLNPIQALPEATEIIDLWEEDNLPEKLNAPGVIVRYLWTMAEKSETQAIRADTASQTAKTLQKYWTENLNSNKIEAINNEIRKFDRLKVFFPELYSKNNIMPIFLI